MSLKTFDDNYRNQANKDVLGIDEAGRGPLAGPLVVAGVILPKDFDNEKINDSKKLSKKVREELFETINKAAKAVFVEIISPEEIDRVNILQATINANNKIASQIKGVFIITDYITLEDKYDFISLTKADTKSLSVAAASIIAKVTRDKIMKEYDRLYPQYGFITNQGYGTKKHLLAIEEHGRLAIHRESFKINKKDYKDNKKNNSKDNN